MCAICGCGTATSGKPAAHHHRHHPHHHHDNHWHGADGSINFGTEDSSIAAPGTDEARTIRIEREILAKNDVYARANRSRLAAAGQFALNFVSSPGSGKTSLLIRMITDLSSQFAIAVIEGDQQTSNDADRIRATGVPAVQINTGKGCHLDARMVGHALDQLPLRSGGLLCIENVGNLVCPAAFDLGEAHKVVVLSVTEGEDKPLKYPDMFAQADLMLLNKADLLSYLDFDVTACVAYARRVNPGIDILTVSARTGEGMTAFHRWIEERAPNGRRDVACAPT